MKRALMYTADLASLALALPACATVMLCSWRSGGTGIGRHSVFGCLASASPGAGGAPVTASAAAYDLAWPSITVTACEAGLLLAFCCLQVVQLVAGVCCLLTGAAARLQLHSVAAGLLLVTTASVAVNNPSSFLYSAAFVLLVTGLTAKLAGVGLSLAVFVDAAVASEANRRPPVGEGSFQRRPSGQRLPFADEDERVVYEFRDGRLEWRIGDDRGSNDCRPSTTAG